MINNKQIRGRKVTVNMGDNIDKSLRKFKKIVSADGVLTEYKSREQYEKPSTRKQQKKAKARSRWLKKERELNSVPRANKPSTR